MRKLYARATWIVVGFLVMALVTGCTLSGAEEPPLTPVGDTGLPSSTPPPTEEVLPPLPTTVGPIDVFATQTAQGALGGTPTIEGQPTEIGGTPGVGATPSPAPLTPQATTGGTAGPCPPTHTVQAGENLFRIAMQYGLTWQELAAANGITNPEALQVGQVLNIPGCESAETGGGQATPAPGGASTHTVQPGENLFRIALKYGITWQELAAANDITDPTSLQVGQVLTIPPAD